MSADSDSLSILSQTSLTSLKAGGGGIHLHFLSEAVASSGHSILTYWSTYHGRDGVFGKAKHVNQVLWDMVVKSGVCVAAHSPERESSSL